ncbi:unnamed protein product [Macrosiphum euphorbiae]|uniref:Uncharacterized protein n=1 Tax=Macrosiphum euphorbiae TaxID=13131 RepID=A0AAV0VJW0_9HEMI|nr:unnamed protein product [Macrosiphum euphorbiae]
MSETEREMSTRERFLKKLMESVEGKKDNYYNITKDAYDLLLKEIEDAISATKKPQLNIEGSNNSMFWNLVIQKSW